jgi:hypothetical protein
MSVKLVTLPPHKFARLHVVITDFRKLKHKALGWLKFVRRYVKIDQVGQMFKWGRLREHTAISQVCSFFIYFGKGNQQTVMHMGTRIYCCLFIP